jgi:hypothetical protein
MGSIHYVCGWKRARQFLFPLSLFAFMIPVRAVEQFSTFLGVYAAEKGQAIYDYLRGEMGPGWRPTWGVVGFVGHSRSISFFLVLLLVGYVFAFVSGKTWKRRTVFLLFMLPVAITTDVLCLMLADVFRRSPDHEAWFRWYNSWDLPLQIAIALSYFLLLSLFLRLTDRVMRPGSGAKASPDAPEGSRPGDIQ